MVIGTRVTISPASVNLAPGQTQQFNKSVTGLANTAVTWSATGGSIDSSGLFTAGNSAGAFVVRATSVVDASISGTAVVGIDALADIKISPSLVGIKPGGPQQFIATVTGNANQTVLWTATGGQITPQGLFTAGNVQGSFEVTASLVNASLHASATVGISALTFGRYRTGSAFANLPSGNVTCVQQGSRILHGEDPAESARKQTFGGCCRVKLA